MKLFLIIAYLVGLAYEVGKFWDIYHNKHQTPNHNLSLAVRILYFLYVTVWFVLWPINPYLIWRVHTILFFLGAAYWIPFELIVNSMMKVEWNYLGDTAKQDTTLNKWFGRNAGSYLFLFKIFCLALSIALLIYT